MISNVGRGLGGGNIGSYEVTGGSERRTFDPDMRDMKTPE